MDTDKQLKGKRVAFLATDGVEQSELTQPWEAIEKAGGKPELISLSEGEIQGVHHDQNGDRFTVDCVACPTIAEQYDALVVPGGVMNPDKLRQNQKAVDFVKKFFQQHKPVASICHGPQVLIEAEVVEGRKLTSYGSIRKDLENAGANWVDEECVCDEGLVTSRSPDDLPAFCDKLVEEVAEGKHEAQVA